MCLTVPFAIIVHVNGNQYGILKSLFVLYSLAVIVLLGFNLINYKFAKDDDDDDKKE